jgi:hypothetical protein
MASAAGTAFSAAHRMIYRVHGNTAYMGTLAHISFLSGFPELYIHILKVSNLPNRGFAIDIDHTDFTAGHSDPGIIAFLGAKCSCLPGRPGYRATGTGFHFNISASFPV